MRRQKCTKCGTLLDVSRLETGAKFACATCGTVLVVGETVAVKRSLKEGPVFKPRVKAEPAAPTPSRRAAAPAEPARERAPRAEAAPKSKAPLLVGLGALVVSGIVIAVVASRGGGETGAGGGGTSASGGGGGLTPSRWWEGVSARVGAGDEKELLGILADAKARGFDQDRAFWGSKADEIHQALLRRNRDSAEANRYFGKKSLRDYPEFDALWGQMVEHLKVLPEPVRAFVARHEAAIEAGQHVWLDAGEGYDSEKAVLDSFVEWKKQLDADPAPEQIARATAQASGFAKDLGMVAVMARPWLVLLASRQLRQADDSDAEKQRVEGARRALEGRGEGIRRALAVVHREFETRFREPLGLEPIGKDKVLVFWLVDDRSAYEEQVRVRSRGAAAGDLPTWFSPRERWAYGHLPDEADPGGLPDLAAGAATQLQWHFSKDPKKPFEDYFAEWNGFWFDAGFAEYIGGGARADSFTGVSPRAVETLKKIRDHAMPLFPVRQLVEQRSRESFERYWSSAYWPSLSAEGDVPEAVTDLLRSEPAGFPLRAFRAQAWYLAYFLNEYGSGKYRNAYRDLLMAALRGRHKPAAYGSGRWTTSHEAFAQILGLKTEEDWARLEQEYKDHVSSALSKG